MENGTRIGCRGSVRCTLKYGENFAGQDVATFVVRSVYGQATRLKGVECLVIDFILNVDTWKLVLIVFKARKVLLI